MKLKQRLNAVFNELNDGESFADIGCDHGKLSAKALLENKTSKVIAVDISKESLKKTELLKEKYNLSNLITRVGDGLSVINKDEVDTIVIAGMGGMEIIKILQNSKNTFTKYIFVPHSNTKELREYLKDKFLIQKDYLVKENNKYYFVLVVTKGKTTYSPQEMEFGQITNSQLLTELLNKKLGEYKDYLSKVVKPNEKTELQNKIQLIQGILQCQKQ